MVSPAVIWTVFGFALAAMFWPGQAEAAEGSRWAFLSVAVPLLLFWCKPRTITAAHIIGGALWCWAALSLLWGTVIWDGLNGLWHLTLMAVLFVLAAELDDPLPLYRGLALGLIVSSVICIFQACGYQPVVTVAHIDSPWHPNAGLFVNAQFLGEAAAPVLLLMLGYGRWGLAAAIVPALILSDTRSALLAVTVGFCVTLWPLWKRGRALAWAIVPVAIITIGVALKYHQGLEERPALWLDTLSGITIFGHGIGSFYVDFPVYATRMSVLFNGTTTSWDQTLHAHSDYLEFAFELGLVGLGLVLAFAIALYRQCRMATPEWPVLAGLAAMSVVGFPFYEPVTGALFAIMAGVLVGTGHRLRRSPPLWVARLYGGREQPEHPFAPACGANFPAGA